MTFRTRTLIAALTAACTFSCASQQELADQLSKATSQAHLRKVVACWEHEFEAAGFAGAYVAVVNFTIEGGTGRMHAASLEQLIDTSTKSEADSSATKQLRQCLVDALNSSNVGPGGMKPASDVHVRGMRILLRDASREARAKASEREANILIGPRADRCQGMYGHDPPREATKLFAELDEAQNKAASLKSEDADGHARALQRSYDVALELQERLALDATQTDLPAASRKRTIELLTRASETARRIGKLIGCIPPA